VPDPAPLIPGAGPVPVFTSADVRAQLPDILLRPETDPIREAIVAALTALMQEWQYRSDYAVAQSDAARAVGVYLEAAGGDRGAGLAIGEDPEAFRARMFSQRAGVNEKAIVAGVNAILALYTTEQCQFVDAALDCWFINDGTDSNGNPAIWHSYVGAGPSYPDRYFSDDLANNGGTARQANCDVGGARVFDDTLGRLFLLRVPDLGFQQLDASFVYDGSAAGDFFEAHEAGGFFVGDGTDVPAGGYLDANDTDPEAAYRAIGNFVNLAAGQSVRWIMLPLDV
jgi:hypothetical protein